VLVAVGMENVSVEGGPVKTRGNRLNRRLRSSSGSILNFSKVGLILLAGVTTHLCRSMAASTLFFGIGSVQLGVVVIAGGFCRRHGGLLKSASMAIVAV